MRKSNSYRQADCCSDKDCYALDYYDDRPCWGQVSVVEEQYTEDDYWWVHACEGHADCTFGRDYIPEPNDK